MRRSVPEFAVFSRFSVLNLSVILVFLNPIGFCFDIRGFFVCRANSGRKRDATHCLTVRRSELSPVVPFHFCWLLTGREIGWKCQHREKPRFSAVRIIEQLL